jgi:RNA polymerase primary sigma factor
MRQIKITQNITRRTEESIESYLTAISKEQMVNPEEEVELAQRIHHGDQAALDKLVRANLRFVVSVAKLYQNQGLSLSDLISEGNVGLVKAAEKFDETRGFKFISYAVWWIRQSIMQALSEQARMVRLPGNQNNLIRQIRVIQNRYEQEMNRPATIEEIAEELDVAPEKIRETMAANNRGVSLDSPLQDDEDGTLLDITPDTKLDSTDATLNNESLHIELENLLHSMLKEREALIIKETFGIDCPEKSQEEVSQELGLTRERVRQIRERALLKIRKSPNAKLLLAYL